MKIARRTFLKGTAAVGGITLASKFLYGPSKTLVAGGSKTPAPAVDKWVPTTCWIGKQDCGMLARVVNGRVVKFEGHPLHPRNQGTLCPKGMGQIIAM
ncbi:MAG: nitrate reductase, partial [Dehalococcoidia bacterium]